MLAGGYLAYANVNTPTTAFYISFIYPQPSSITKAFAHFHYSLDRIQNLKRFSSTRTRFVKTLNTSSKKHENADRPVRRVQAFSIFLSIFTQVQLNMD